MGAVQLSHIKSFINNKFDGLIDLTGARSEKERAPLLLARGLAAMALVVTSNLTPEEAAKAVIDRGDDGGIDAIYHDRTKKEAIFVQAKWSNGGNKTISQGDGLKFINGIRNIIRFDFSSFNEEVRKRESDITTFLLEPKYTVRVVFIHVSNEAISPHFKDDMTRFLNEMNDTSDLFSFEEINQRMIHKCVRSGGEESIDIDIDMYDFGFTTDSRKVFYGKVSAAAVADWKEKNSAVLFDKNIRTFLGDTVINSSIVDSLRNNQGDFLIFNNGITIICDRINDSVGGAGSGVHRRLRCEGVQVVNGAQTVGACHKAKFKDNIDVSSAFVMSKIIEVGADDSLAELITRATNTQNKIERKDFVSLDEVQKDLRTSFSLIDVDYLIKSGETCRSKSGSLTLEEATVALIVQKQDVDLASLAKREIGKIWENIDGKIYTSLFDSRIDVPRLWKLVGILRAVDKFVAAAANVYGGRGKAYAVHGNIFLAMQVCKRLSLGVYYSGVYDEKLLESEVKKQSVIVFFAVFHIGEANYNGSYLAHLFRNAGKCRDIASKLDDEIEKLLPTADSLVFGVDEANR